MSGTGLRPASGVGVVIDEELDTPRVFLARLPDGPLLVLEGSSAVIWQAATTSGPGDLVPRVAEATGAPADEIGGEVQRFVRELMERGFLETAGDATN